MDSLKAATTALRVQRSLPSLKSHSPDWSKLPDMPAMPSLPSGEDVSRGWESVRKRIVGEPTPSRPPPRPLAPSAAPTLEQQQEPGSSSSASSMWNRVLAAVHLPLHDDGYESDQDGYQGETHLTRIMKEYYVARVDDASQLPGWLFPTHERTTYQQHTRPRPKHAPPLQEVWPGGSIFSDVPTPSQKLRKYSDDDSGYGSASSSPAHTYAPLPMQRAGSRTTDKLRAMRRPHVVDMEDGEPLLDDRSAQMQMGRKPISPSKGLPARGAHRLRT